jgi:tRNA 2-thiouridine synthesizing protein A
MILGFMKVSAPLEKSGRLITDGPVIVLNGRKVSGVVVDARGRACPMPMLMLAKALRTHDEVRLFADDPAACADVKALCESAGHELVELKTEGPLLEALVRRGL